MAENEKVNCVACAEVIKAEALLCKFCQTRQDDPNFKKLSVETDSPQSSVFNWKIILAAVLVLTVLGSLLYTLVASSRAETAVEIAKSVRSQVYKLAALNLMGPLKKVTCSPQGISIVLPNTDYKCFAQDATGGGLMFKAKMEWSTGLYSYGLDRGD
jgi:hypothetical protein